MIKFKIGDKVKCIENTSYFLHENTIYGNIYTVNEVLTIDPETVHIKLLEINGKFNDYNQDKFELVIE